MTIQRKVLGYGFSCLITLPKYWVMQKGIEKGDKVSIEIENDGRLTISSLRKNEA